MNYADSTGITIFALLPDGSLLLIWARPHDAGATEEMLAAAVKAGGEL